jgi:hypothetical protein
VGVHVRPAAGPEPSRSGFVSRAGRALVAGFRGTGRALHAGVVGAAQSVSTRMRGGMRSPEKDLRERAAVSKLAPPLLCSCARKPCSCSYSYCGSPYTPTRDMAQDHMLGEETGNGYKSWWGQSPEVAITHLITKVDKSHTASLLTPQMTLFCKRNTGI